MLNTITRSELTAQLWSKASKDEGFKNSLMEDANGVLQRDFGLHIPSGTTVRIVQESPQEMYLVLPQSLDSMPVSEVPEKVREVVREPFTGTESCGCTNANTC
jgi:hypothetical protein